MDISFEEVKKRLGEYGDYELTALPLMLGFQAKEEGRKLTEDEVLVAHMSAWLYKQVEEQMMHLANICEEPVWNPAQLDSKERDGLNDYFSFNAGDEKIAARALLVKLHKPTPDDLEGEELQNWYDEQRSEFVAVLNITVSEALDYVAYWEQEREGVEAMRWFATEMEIAQGVAEITGDDVPRNIGEFLEYMQKRAEEEEG